MVTAEAGGNTANNTSSSYGGGGAGGKFRKKPFRRQATPYDRPPTAFRGTNNGGNRRNWLTKLFVDPASKLISYGANRFFASVFRKRLPPPPPPPPQPPEVKNDVKDGVHGGVRHNLDIAPETADGEFSLPVDNSRNNGISELEQLLKQKTFSRSEITHLTELLQSRALEVSNEDDGHKNEETASDFGRHEQIASGSLEEKRNEGIMSSAVMLTPVPNSEVLEDDVATPAELAKAYMGGKPSKVSPSVLGMRHQVRRKDPGLLSNKPFASKSPNMSLTKKTSVGLAAPENGFITPRSRGRSAIYNMARTPYSRVQQTSILKGRGINCNGNTGPLASSLMENNENFESQPMTLKRRSLVLDDDVGSLGSVRRIRQKPNLLAPRIPHASHGAGNTSQARQKLQVIGEPSHKVTKAVGETVNESVPSTSHARVPSKSSEVAARIFQHLEKLTPKEKSSESKLAAVQEKPHLKLTPGMLSGQALRSMEDVNSSKLLLDVPCDHNLGDNPNSNLPDTCDYSSQKPRNVEENGPKESANPSDMWNPVIKNDSADFLQASRATTKTTDTVVEYGASQPPDKKRGFRMSALEDLLDQDDDVNCNGSAPALLSETSGSMEGPLTDKKLAPAEVPKLAENTLLPEMKSPSCLVLSRTSEVSNPGAVTIREENNDATVFPASEEATATSQSAALPRFIAAFEKPAEAISPPMVGFSSTVADKFTNLPSEPCKMAESKGENSCSLVDVSTSVASQVKIPESDKFGHSNPLKAGDMNEKFHPFPPEKGPHASSAPVSFTAASSDDINQTSTSGAPAFTSISFSNLVPAATSSGSIFGLSAKPSNLAGTAFNFGSSVDPLTAVSSSTSKTFSEIADVRTKSEGEPSSGNSSISHSSVAALAAANPGNSIFGVGSFVNHSAAIPQGSHVGSVSDSVVSGTGTVSQGGSVLSVSSASSQSFNVNTSSTSGSSLCNSQVSNPGNTFGIGAGTVSQGTSVLLVSSASSSPALFNMNTSTSSGSSVSNSQVSTPSNTLGFSSLASSSDATAIVPGSGPISSVLKFGASPAFVSKGTTPNSGSVATPGVFSFGFSSSSSSTNASGSSTVMTLPKFNFGGSSSASPSVINNASSASSGASVVFSFGGSSSSSSAINSVCSNTAPNVFGSSWQSPSSSIFGSSFTSPSPSTGFSFGASSTSPAPTSIAPLSFNSSAGASSSPFFPFTTASASASSSLSLPNNQPIFGNPPVSGFASPPGNNDQMNAEDSMAEDPVQSSAPSVPVFGQSSVSPSPSGFTFGSTVPSQANPFMFGSQQNQVSPQNQPPFQASGSLEFNAGGSSFSLGSGGGDKSTRKMVKVSRTKNRKR